MNFRQPEVSVCIPVYNPGPFLEQALDSVLAQEFADLELLIVDDNSIEQVDTAVGNYHDPRIAFYHNRYRLGLVGNWNRCLELARGRYVTLLHQDDLMRPGNLRRKVEALDANPGAGFAYSDIKTIDASGQQIGGHWLPQPPVDAVFSGRELFEMVANAGNVISCPSVVARRECYQRLGFFNAELPFAVDLEMWLRIAKQYDVVYLAEPLIEQRVHPNQETAHFQGTGADYFDMLRAFDILRAGGLPSEFEPLMAQAYRTLSTQAFGMAKWKLRQGQIQNGLRYVGVYVQCLAQSFLTTWKMTRRV